MALPELVARAAKRTQKAQRALREARKNLEAVLRVARRDQVITEKQAEDITRAFKE